MVERRWAGPAVASKGGLKNSLPAALNPYGLLRGITVCYTGLSAANRPPNVDVSTNLPLTIEGTAEEPAKTVRPDPMSGDIDIQDRQRILSTSLAAYGVCGSSMESGEMVTMTKTTTKNRELGNTGEAANAQGIDTVHRQ